MNCEGDHGQELQPGGNDNPMDLSFAIALRNLDYGWLLGEAHVLAEFENCIRHTVAAEVGNIVMPEDVMIAHVSDSVTVHCALRPPQGVSCDELQSRFAPISYVAENLATNVSSIEGLAGVVVDQRGDGNTSNSAGQEVLQHDDFMRELEQQLQLGSGSQGVQLQELQQMLLRSEEVKTEGVRALEQQMETVKLLKTQVYDLEMQLHANEDINVILDQQVKGGQATICELEGQLQKSAAQQSPGNYEIVEELMAKDERICELEGLLSKGNEKDQHIQELEEVIELLKMELCKAEEAAATGYGTAMPDASQGESLTSSLISSAPETGFPDNPGSARCCDKGPHNRAGERPNSGRPPIPPMSPAVVFQHNQVNLGCARPCATLGPCEKDAKPLRLSRADTAEAVQLASQLLATLQEIKQDIHVQH